MIIIGLYGAFEWEANKSFDSHDEFTWVHDSGATLFINEKHICSISEERLTRIKHDGNFPEQSIAYCLKEGNISYEDVDHVYIPSMCLDIFYRQLTDGVIENKIKETFPNAEFHIVSHHLSHAASSVFSSEFDEGSIITLDGAGSLIYDYSCSNSIHAETNLIGSISSPGNTNIQAVPTQRSKRNSPIAKSKFVCLNTENILSFILSSSTWISDFLSSGTSLPG